MNSPRSNTPYSKRLAAGVFIGLLSVGAYAAPGGVPGPGGGGGGGGNGGGGNGGGGGGTGGGSAPPDLGDLIVLYRNADGIPILTPDSCQQPLAAPGVTVTNLTDGTVACTPASSSESCVIPVDPATCAIVPGYETYTQEVDFGRTSVVRSPASVLASQLDDVIVNLATADCVSLDPAGRLVTSTVDANNVVTSAPIDSPLQNLAIYKQIMLTGHLGADTDPLHLPESPLDAAARGLGTASDKTGKVNVDMVAYLNQILGLTDPTVTTFLPKKCVDVKEEVKGVVQLVQKCFLDYGATGGNYAYGRAANFASLPSPPSIPAAGPQAGWFEYLNVLDPAIPSFGIGQGPIVGAVPELMADPTFAASNIGGFAQAADDARATINFMHSWPLPLVYATPLTCAASGATHYDVSISSDSGLQVPVRMVAGTEGREFTLTVSNAGPDEATGVVSLSAVDADGNPVPTFPRDFPFTLAAGTSKSWTEGFSINYVTTITWTATANAEYDVNSGNNSVTATTQVIGSGSTGGGGGGGGGTGGGGGGGGIR